jgi:iron complex transport system substrate-binding protein
VRVVTLLPAATEIVAALGAVDQLVGISHECDYPDAVRKLPRVTATPIDVQQPGALIDAGVRRLSRAGEPVIGINAAQLSMLAPDLIITQNVCEVCAVADGQVHHLATTVEGAPRVVSLGAPDLEGIWTDVRRIGSALDVEDQAQKLVAGLQSRIAALRARTSGGTTRRILCFEWLDPLYIAGHWIPELVSAAGGKDVGARPGDRSARANWSELPQLLPDHIIVMLCGFGIERARAELCALRDSMALELMRRVPTWIIDGNAFTSRPGPRVVEAAELIHSAICGKPSVNLERWRPAC